MLEQGKSSRRRLRRQRRKLVRMRTKARHDCEESLSTLRELLSAIFDLVALGYEKTMCRSASVDSLLERIDETLDELETAGAAEDELAALHEPAPA